MNDTKFMKLFVMCFYKILKLFCLAPFTIDFKTMKFQNSRFSIFLNVFIVSIFIYFDDALDKYIYEDHNKFFMSKLVNIFNSLLSFKSYLLLFTCVLLFSFKKQQQRKGFNDFMEVISFLRMESLVFVLRQKTKKFLKIQLVFVLYFTISRYIYYIALNKNPSWMIGLILIPLSQYRYFIIITLVAQKHFLFVFFECCYKALNISLKAQIKICKDQSELSDLVDKTAKIHFRLLEVVFYLNKYFAIIIVMIILDTLINFVVEDFIVYLSSMLYYRYHFNDDKFQIFIMETVTVALYGAVRIGQFVVILGAGCNTIKEVNK